MKSFQEWLNEKEDLRNEVSTSTGDVATFPRRWPQIITREKIKPWGEEDPFFRKKKKK